MSTPINADRLNALVDAGVSPANVIEELLWLQFKGIDITRDEGREAYIRLSRKGRNFAINRRTRHLLCDYAERVACVIVTNCEGARLGYVDPVVDLDYEGYANPAA